jgi:OpgC protein
VLLTWPGASAIIKSGRCSLQVFCLGAIVSVAFNLFVAVDAPFLMERLMLDVAAVISIALMATLLVRRRQGLVPGPTMTAPR